MCRGKMWIAAKGSGSCAGSEDGKASGWHESGRGREECEAYAEGVSLDEVVWKGAG